MESLDVVFITTKEASKRYGMSTKWFEKRRYEGKEPSYVQIDNHTVIYYNQIETDKWFKDKFRIK